MSEGKESNEFEKKVMDVLSKMKEQPLTEPEKAEGVSLDYFYKVKDSYKRKKKQVNIYDFTDDVFIENGVSIVPINDVHLGHHSTNIEYFESFVNYILETPNCVTILNGDLAETATKGSVGKAMFEEDLHFPEQMDKLTELLMPLAKAGKILGVGPGNHEERIANLIGQNPMAMLARELGVPYFGYQGFFQINVNGLKYKIAAHHGAGGGGTTGSKTNTSEKMNKVVSNADLYISGHTHGKQFHQDVIYVMEDDNEELMPHVRTYVVSGSFVEYWGAYPEMKALAPSITGLVRCDLRPDKKEVRITI